MTFNEANKENFEKSRLIHEGLLDPTDYEKKYTLLRKYLTRGGFIQDRNGKWCKDGDKVLLEYRRDLDIDCIEGTLDWTGCNFNVILPNVKCHDWINLHSRFSFELTEPCEPDICKDFEEE